MSVETRELASFYEGPLGAVSRRFVGRVLARLWPNLHGLRLLGLGYPVPYLPGPDAGCERVAAFMPAPQRSEGACPVQGTAWPAPPARPCCALVDLDAMPLPDACFDRILVVHALETVESPAELLHELARVLAPEGRVIVVCPNRRGLWARMDTTPFGHGQPFSRSQLRGLMRRTGLSPERWAETLYMPPLASPLVLRGAGVWERVGSGLALPFAGLHVVEAVKSVAEPVPVARRERRRRPVPVMVPVPASRAGL